MPRTLVCPSRKRVVISIFAFISSLIVLAGVAPAQTRNRITRGSRTLNRWRFQCRTGGRALNLIRAGSKAA